MFFIFSCLLDIDRVSRIKLDLHNMDPLRIQKQIAANHLSQSNYSLQVVRSNKHLPLVNSTTGHTPQPTYKKQIRLENRSMTSSPNNNCSRLIVYPVCYMLDQSNNSTETVCQLLDSGHQRNEKCCMVECANDLMVRVKLTLVSDVSGNTVFCQHDRLVWFEIGPNEALTLALDFDYGPANNSAKSSKHYTEFERKFHQNFTMSLFWIESDLNMYCINGESRFDLSV